MNKFDKLYNKIIKEEIIDNDNPLTIKEKQKLKERLEQIFDSNNISDIYSSIKGAYNIIATARPHLRYCGDNKLLESLSNAIDYLYKIKCNIETNNVCNFDELKQMFVDYCLEKEDYALLILETNDIRENYISTRAFIKGLGDKFGFNARHVFHNYVK